MKYDVTVKLKDHRGRPLPLKQDEKGAPVGESSLSDVLEFACCASSDVVKSLDDKVKVGRILQRIVAAKPILELEAAEVDLLKRMVAALYPAPIVIVIVDVLENPISEKPLPTPAEPPSR